jgi:hypothetical protein
VVLAPEPQARGQQPERVPPQVQHAVLHEQFAVTAQLASMPLEFEQAAVPL